MSDRYYEPDSETEDEEIFMEEEVPAILNEVKPESLSSLCEAIGEDCLFRRKEQIEHALYHRDFAELGRLVWACNMDYWENYAESLAQSRWVQGYHD